MFPGVRDQNNKLLRFLAEAGSSVTPLVVSTGMSDLAQVEATYKVLMGNNKRFALLQCTSSYPTQAEDVNLRHCCRQIKYPLEAFLSKH